MKYNALFLHLLQHPTAIVKLETEVPAKRAKQAIISGLRREKDKYNQMQEFLDAPQTDMQFEVTATETATLTTVTVNCKESSSKPIAFQVVAIDDLAAKPSPST